MNSLVSFSPSQATTLGNVASNFSPLFKRSNYVRPGLQNKSLDMENQSERRGVVCSAVGFRPPTLQWVSAVSSAVLMMSKGNTIKKSFLVPLFALHAPYSVISWIKGEFGTWTVFLALLARLYLFIPVIFSIIGQLELPFMTMLIMSIAPYQVMSLRGTQAGAVVSLAIAAYLAFEHFTRTGGLQRSFDHVSVVPTLSIICITIVSCMFLF